MTHEAKNTSIADEKWAGKITAHETTIGMRIGRAPSRQMRRCAGCPHVQKRHEGRMRSLSIFDCRPASCWARKSTVATFSASEGWNWNPPTGIQRAAPLTVDPTK